MVVHGGLREVGPPWPRGKVQLWVKTSVKPRLMICLHEPLTHQQQPLVPPRRVQEQRP